ncbi:hypothetical protein DRQ53_08875 [bacterium]|nr:MAG: hypothetical protein DRQ32_03385 [bacterium]RKZ15504.1 MAG: hypothetical protein DRQ53_08875 [bacterium]
MRFVPCLAISCLLITAAAGCTQGGEKLDGQKVPARSAPAATGAQSLEPAAAGSLELASLAFKAPEDWSDDGASGMRKGSYSFGPSYGDELAAEVTVFFFGEGQGGDIESNIRRWVGQMDPPEGKTIEESVLRSQRESADGFTLHFVEIDGIYQRSMGGGPMTGGRTKAFPGWRMVGAIVEAPGGNVFFKLVGPQQTAQTMEEGLRAMLDKAARI